MPSAPDNSRITGTAPATVEVVAIDWKGLNNREPWELDPF